MRRCQRGSALVQALILTAMLVALLGTFAAHQHVASGVVQTRLRERRAEAAARAGVAYALAVLQGANADLVTLQDDWASLGGESGSEIFELGEGASYRVQVLDTASQININTAPQAQLEQLPLTTGEIASLLDWREESQTPRPEGAKDETYNALATPYNARLGDFSSVSELLLVQGWTGSMLYAPLEEPVSAAALPTDTDGNTLPLASLLTAASGAPNTRADGSARVNLTTGINVGTLAQLGIQPPLANALAATLAGNPPTNFENLLARPGVNATVARQFLDGATFSGDERFVGRINVNTASEAALLTLPGMTPDIASDIVERQSTGFQTLGELSSVPGLTGQVLGRLADAACVGSDTFLVRAYGESGGVGIAVEATISLQNDSPQIVRYARLPNPRPPAWWMWTGEAAAPEERS